METEKADDGEGQIIRVGLSWSELRECLCRMSLTLSTAVEYPIRQNAQEENSRSGNLVVSMVFGSLKKYYECGKKMVDVFPA